MDVSSPQEYPQKERLKEPVLEDPSPEQGVEARRRGVFVLFDEVKEYIGPARTENLRVADKNAAEEGHRMPDTRDVQQLLVAASRADTFEEQQRLVGEAEQLRSGLYATARAQDDIDFASAVVAERLTPVAVHEYHTAATDWIGSVASSQFDSPEPVEREMAAQAVNWYQGLHVAVKADSDEFEQQAIGFSRRLAGAYGEWAGNADEAFLDRARSMRAHELKTGSLKEAASTLPQVGDGAYPSDVFSGLSNDPELPVDQISSNRAPNMQVMMQNGQGGASQDVTPVNDPGLGQADTQVDRTNNGEGGLAQSLDAGYDRLGADAARHTAAGTNDTMLNDEAGSDGKAWPTCPYCGKPVSPIAQVIDGQNRPIHQSCIPDPNAPARKESSMQTAKCPTCGGHGKVAVRAVPQPTIEDVVRQAAFSRVAFSGLDQITQVVDPSDTSVKETELPPEVAWPWTMVPGQVENNIGQAEQQIAEREQRKGASRQKLAEKAARAAYNMARNQGMARLDPAGTFDPQHRHATLHQQAQTAARLAFQRVMAGQDDSGWAGDMGAAGVTPGEQDGGNPPGVNLGMPDPVYGEGGDQGNRPLRPYSLSEANDVTNQPGTWSPGQPTQMDLGGQVQQTTVPGGGGPAFPNPPINGKQSSIDEDPEIAKALAFVRHRRAHLERQASTQNG